MDDVQLANYLAGLHKGPLEVTRLEDDLARLLGVATHTPVWLSDYTIMKTSFRHEEINFRDYVMLPEIISCGFIVSGRKTKTAEICYFKSKDLAWRIVIKSTSKNDVYITMIHRSGPAKIGQSYRRAVKSGTLVRPPKTERAQALLDRARQT